MQLVWALITPLPPLPHEMALRAPPPVTDSRRVDIGLLAQQNPFSGNAAPVETVDSVAPETTLDLSLFGIRAGVDVPGAAIIRMPDGRQAVFTPGEEIVRGVRLAEIRADRVILSRGGAREALFLDPDGARSPGAPVAPPQAQETVIQNVDVLLRRLRLTPRLDAGRINGVRVAPNGPEGEALFQRAGFRPGDILTAVNGRELTGPQALQAVGAGLRERDDVSLTIERNGQSQTLRFRID